jgi:hypothetical protein
MPQGRSKDIVISILILLFIGAGLPKMYAGSVFLSKRISLNVQKQSLENVLFEIEKKADIQFMYNPKMLNISRIVSAQFQDVSLREILQSIINNKDLVFYEMGKFIVITSKLKAKDAKNVFTAILPTDQDMRKTIKTVVFYDTVTTTFKDTIRVSIVDTTTIFDTVKVISNGQKALTKLPVVAVPVKLQWFAEADFAPLYADILPDSKWKGDLSFLGQMAIGVKRNNIHFSIGIGSMWQRGYSPKIIYTTSIDSVIQRDTVQLMEKYILGDYYSIHDKDTIRTVVYDSSVIAIPRHWYNKTEHTTVEYTSVSYSIVWVTIPIKVEYEWTVTKKMAFRLGLSIIPAFAVKTKGELYVPSLGTAIPINTSGLKSYSVFTSLEPTLSYALTKKLSVHCTPLFQMSIKSILNEKAYYFGGGARFGIRKTF